MEKQEQPRTDVPSGDGPVRRSLFDVPPPEVPGDVFDRQRVMVSWQQKKVEEATALVLGCGGLGNGVAMGLCRLGLRKLILVDMDDVEATNLNRQILFTKNVVGMRKVDAAKLGLESGHNLRSEFETLHIDAVKEWHKVVEAARRADVIFNCIDHGAIYDYATNSLAKVLGVPLVTGSSYANTALVNFYTGRPGMACWSCLNTTSESFEWTQQELEEWMSKNGHSAFGVAELFSFLKDQAHMEGLHVKDAVAAGLVDFWAGRDDGRAAEANVIPIKDIRTFLIKFVQPHILALLSPEHIMNHESIGFIPKDKNFPTRYVGSWVCVCVSAALLMVNAWAQDLAGEAVANYNNFTLNTFHASNSQQDGADGKSDSFCVICKHAAPQQQPAQ